MSAGNRESRFTPLRTNRSRASALPSDIETVTDSAGRFRVRLFRKAVYELEFYPPQGSPYLAIRKQQIPPTAGVPV